MGGGGASALCEPASPAASWLACVLGVCWLLPATASTARAGLAPALRYTQCTVRCGACAHPTSVLGCTACTAVGTPAASAPAHGLTGIGSGRARGMSLVAGRWVAAAARCLHVYTARVSMAYAYLPIQIDDRLVGVPCPPRAYGCALRCRAVPCPPPPCRRRVRPDEPKPKF